ncbi:MAG TPA: twin-arginine translocation signal domain-containing protein [Longimicrobiaceae bacterium]|nr:twin-arginine translocation signal domain-containing protein [Longimicrobiaceae bacterium]
MDRRRFLKLAGAGVVAGLATSGCEAGGPSGARSLDRPDLLTALAPERVRAIGARYRRMVAGERDAGSLRSALLGPHTLRSRLPWLSPTVGQRIHDDFERGDTVVVDGWILSVTEARQCALFSLLPA